MADDGKGFFAGLFDFTFTNLVTPKVIKILYGIALLVLGLVLLAMMGAMLVSLINGDIGPALVIMIAIPFYAVFGLIGMRMYFELIILAFRVLETLDRIAKNTGG